ncbi:MAG: demethoxyubiquinone hydroxylase family protein [Bacteriovoracaceae bacterium]
MDDKIIKKLEDLHQLDFDAVKAYEEAIERIKNPTIKNKLTEYKNDHLNHLQNLEELIVSKGGEKPDRKKDIKGYLIEGMTLIRSSMGDEQALKAMRQNEEITNKKYADALKELSSEPEVSKVLNHNYEDERKHLVFIKEALENPDHFKGPGAEEASPGL